MSLARASRQYLGVRALLPPDLQYATRNPTTTDKAYVKGTLWLNTSAATAFMWPGSGSWIALGSGATGGVVTINSLSPSAGNINIVGTANQVGVANAGSTVTLSIPAAFIAPGSIASTTTITSGTALVATTSVTATLGNITATNGNFVKGTAGNKDVYTSLATTTAAGANSAGTVTLVAGTATIATTSVTASSKIRIYRQGVGATGAAATGHLCIGTITGGTSFVINSVSAADATALATTDVSVVFWEIVN